MIPLKSSWSKGPVAPALLSGEVHLWRAPLTDLAVLPSCFAVLSHRERLTAESFVFDRDRHHYAISHGAVRMVLSRYSGIAPEALEFETGANGKPSLVQRFTDLRFNLSHTDGLALIAVTRGRDVGVDVERIDPEMEFDDIAAHYFEPRELWDLQIAPASERASRFFEVWTRKEACLKATGEGLIGIRSKPGVELDVRSLQPGDGYAGAVACVGSDWRLACWEWSA
jgi:4'-phosphopantetheinyl transferase